MAVSSESPEASVKLERELALGFPVLGDPSLATIAAWQDEDASLGLAWPTLYLVDAHGRIAWFAVVEGQGTASAALEALRSP